MKAICKLIVVTFTFLALSGSVNAETTREQLKQMVVQLQTTPSDNALREKIIKLAISIKPALVVPFEAKRPFVMANTYQKEAKKPSDFALAIDSYQEALMVAPWWGDAYYNLSVSLESAGRLNEAQAALNLYLLTQPNDVEEAQNRLYALEAKKNLAAKQAAEAAVESVFCPWYASNMVGTVITVDIGHSSLTYFERDENGQHKPAIVSSANITESNIGWTQTETFPNQARPTVVRYSLSRISGDLDYWYTSASGEPRTNRLKCVKSQS